MDINKITAGDNLPEEFNVVIEIPMNSAPIKYEFDKDSGAIFVDRFVQTPVFYPCNYGFIPHTLSGDGDPVDILLIANYPLIPGCVIKSRPVGVLVMEDESGIDEKIIAVPIKKIDPYFNDINDIDDINQNLKNKISFFFERYKDLEKGKWVKIKGWENKESAKNFIKRGILKK